MPVWLILPSQFKSLILIHLVEADFWRSKPLDALCCMWSLEMLVFKYRYVASKLQPLANSRFPTLRWFNFVDIDNLDLYWYSTLSSDSANSSDPWNYQLGKSQQLGKQPLSSMHKCESRFLSKAVLVHSSSGFISGMSLLAQVSLKSSSRFSSAELL